MSVHIVLVEPEIPQNTGNIARTCALTKSILHLVRPLGFSTDDKHLKRAGLDYWNLVNINYHDSIEELLDKYDREMFFYATTKGKQRYTDMKYFDNCFLVFGKETRGLPMELLSKNWDRTIRIPMRLEIKRSLNLSNSVNIILYEALRQLDFPGIG
ncbi:MULTISPECIES: tRNA (uridine(34)/cytosine(34)/5-carboxymethylaminomethyluridine(34)-2'-O)-methyltransferase TrmL [Tissierellales]|jgi:tRNA (cytidine/uridine-2'-O-)-methyltransferase|uniref:Putative tRNA (cytidine(34)-2'-O)-methyltransferase n=1 Tax=Acidilutibacter cellobiosedens TaxID=2507161 RepID=A0A410QEG1_9FIRM|nr:MULTISPECIES: tRNA (uridine(34)/cytosine(34)/5-carboxymethylaminomethyluridine(34)-2'-O)-methyltransferase TrmL [Tissierellales]MBE6081626.1 tRNA (uridine(34)/cytosine(34)/5-carboxymethylaminomethyluridine(34)-2'-O)-methyltransferase TrmL [Tissierellaceae bacterium]QAT62432.1 tRNA (uridine(34)/cytosine(34)/5-carboxymethylaminomethyluridine(34)-2'-O)-methyltransferase TrmL [Acidilutibacter cellobiosedens]SCL89108.1 tRNA (cytidine(34)-2'-O)-methyltransferase [Sporanaerobacter sp. PP17-6a]